ncbi:MAG TPA: YbdD/YjiX family protein [Acidobacteriota bacterium]|nr:YbdD/YjiX family protein [Acidobacteriota bacterium]
MRRLLSLWRCLEWVLEGADYRRFCEHLRSRHPGEKVPTEREFYLFRQEAKYSRPSRCC